MGLEKEELMSVERDDEEERELQEYIAALKAELAFEKEKRTALRDWCKEGQELAIERLDCCDCTCENCHRKLLNHLSRTPNQQGTYR